MKTTHSKVSSWWPIGLALLVVLGSCEKATIPKPRGYFRIDLPEARYETYASDCGFSAQKNTLSRVVPRPSDHPDGCWFNVVYPRYRAQVHFTYVPVEGNLDALVDDAYQFAFNHEVKANAIERREYTNDVSDVHGLVYALRGRVATPFQFYVTDSSSHFLRGALYFMNRPNPDSVAPVQQYIEQDLLRWIESLEWHEPKG